MVFITEIEEIIELVGSEANLKFLHFGPKLLKRLVITAQGMHYQAAERSLLFINNEATQKLVKSNL